ncbi:MAG TPA: hypothetical protein VHV56_08770 [Pseudolabrys sp.]|jgi:uncharacterized protein YwgA|nr:hypothetical protein [Pseudolabrys sp.]
MAQPGNTARIIWLNGGRMIGKTRFQKSTYFLEALGIGFGFEFAYHHYGPYSEELASLSEDARALQFLDIEFHRSQDGPEYAIFVAKGENIEGDQNRNLDSLREAALQILKKYTAVELELAATADFLEKIGFGDRAWSETGRRKALKASNDRIARAKQLLQELSTIRSVAH